VATGITEAVTELAIERIEILKELVKVSDRLATLQTELDEEEVSLIPKDTNLDNAVVTLTDEHGNSIGSWRVTSGNIEDALDSLRLESTTEVKENNIKE
jgi:hypothetical protein